MPKNPAASLLFQVASRAKQPAMPPLPNTVEANALSPKELGVLKQWILEGAGGGASAAHDSIQWQPIPSTMKSIESVALSPWGRFAAAGSHKPGRDLRPDPRTRDRAARRSAVVFRAVRRSFDVSSRGGRPRFHSLRRLQPGWDIAGGRWISRRQAVAASAQRPQMDRVTFRQADGACCESIWLHDRRCNLCPDNPAVPSHEGAQMRTR